mmetsp:Transcript_84255/g.243537  ORF Transcript_84255/g.243537 Transcript_84255/m.243537 type:complete len:217 (-) Transcript_84255:228-878(-)
MELQCAAGMKLGSASHRRWPLDEEEVEDDVAALPADGEGLSKLIALLGEFFNGGAPAARAPSGALSQARDIERPLEWSPAPVAQVEGPRNKGDEEALRLLTEFCKRQRSIRVEPSVAELEALLVSCLGFPSSSLCRAFCAQLTWSEGDEQWQPRLRALCAMEHFASRGGRGRVAVRLAVVRAAGLLEHLACAVPECREKAAGVLRRSPMHFDGEGI